MSKLVTCTFAIVGVFVGFSVGLLLVTGVVDFRDFDEAETMTIAFASAAAFAVLFGWAAGRLRDVLIGWKREALGGVGLVLAIGFATYFFGSFW